MQIDIPRDAELQLRALATAAGFGEDVRGFVMHRCLEAAEAHVGSEGTMLPRDKWKAEFEALVASFPKRDTRMDDSRESIYRGRGE